MFIFLNILLLLLKVCQADKPADDIEFLHSEITMLKTHIQKLESQATNQHSDIQTLEQIVAKQQSFILNLDQKLNHFHTLKEHVYQLEEKLENKLQSADDMLQYYVHNIKHSSNNNIIGFGAYATVDRDYNSNDIILFDGLIVNIGNLYDPGSSIFTCNPGGYYLFAASVYAYDKNMVAQLVVGSTVIAKLDANNILDAASVTMVAECAAGTQVFVRCEQDGKKTYGDYRSTFTGVILQLL